MNGELVTFACILALLVIAFTIGRYDGIETGIRRERKERELNMKRYNKRV